MKWEAVIFFVGSLLYPGPGIRATFTVDMPNDE